MKSLFTSPKITIISLAIVALFIVPFTIIELQHQQTLLQHAQSLTCPSGYNGDANSVIWCGAYYNGAARASEITNNYNNGDGHNSAKSIQNIYGSTYFKITSTDIQNLSKDAQVGTVTKTGDVILNGKIVATNALTSGRQNIAGSTQRNNNGTVFYTRPPRVSFLNSALSAYVVMENGKFKFAVLISCGNPISATPVATPTPTLTPTSTPTPTVSPTLSPTISPEQPTPTICPTLQPVNNVRIICPNCQLTPSPVPS